MDKLQASFGSCQRTGTWPFSELCLGGTRGSALHPNQSLLLARLICLGPLLSYFYRSFVRYASWCTQGSRVSNGRGNQGSEGSPGQHRPLLVLIFSRFSFEFAPDSRRWVETKFFGRIWIGLQCHLILWCATLALGTFTKSFGGSCWSLDRSWISESGQNASLYCNQLWVGILAKSDCAKCYGGLHQVDNLISYGQVDDKTGIFAQEEGKRKSHDQDLNFDKLCMHSSAQSVRGNEHRDVLLCSIFYTWGSYPFSFGRWR